MMDAKVAVSILKLFAGENPRSEYRSSMLEIAAFIEDAERKSNAMTKLLQGELLISKEEVKSIATEACDAGQDGA